MFDDAQLRAAYALLRTLPPFNKWDLPDPKSVRFSRITDGSAMAEYCEEDDCVEISISPEFHTTLHQVLMSMAHEMVHIRQDQLGRLPLNPAKHHNAWWRKQAKIVCARLGFDVQTF